MDTSLGSNLLQAGTVVAGRYEVLAPLARGGMGVVYKALQVALNRVVALKVVQLAGDDHTVSLRFRREAHSAAKLSHPNIVSVIDYGSLEDDRPFLVMEYIEGRPLSQVLRKDGLLDEGRARRLFMQICDGLNCAHEQGVIHRDLKPGNILLIQSSSGELMKLIDFGLAKPAFTDENLTHSGMLLGTPLYMSPEQCHGWPTDARSDVYSLGCVLYESLVGSPPLQGDSPISTMFKHLQEMPDRTIPGFCALSQSMRAIIWQCLQKEPAQRFQSALEMKAALESGAWGQDRDRLPAASLCENQAPSAVSDRIPVASATDGNFGLELTFPGESMSEGHVVPSGGLVVPSGSPTVPSGSPAVPSGSPAVPSGSPTVPNGSHPIPSGGPTVPSGSHPVPSGSHPVPSGSHPVPSGSPPVPSGSPTVSSGGPTVPSGSPPVPSGGPTVPSGSPPVPSGGPTVPSGSPTVPSLSVPIPTATGHLGVTGARAGDRTNRMKWLLLFGPGSVVGILVLVFLLPNVMDLTSLQINALPLIEQVNKHLAFSMASDLGDYYLKKSEFADAEHMYRRAAKNLVGSDVWASEQARFESALGLVSIGKANLLSGKDRLPDLNEAVEHSINALNLIKSNGSANSKEILALVLKAGSAYAQRGKCKVVMSTGQDPDMLQQAMGDFHAALGLLEEYYQKSTPQHAEYTEYEANVLVLLNRYDQAITLYSEAINEYQDLPPQLRDPASASRCATRRLELVSQQREDKDEAERSFSIGNSGDIVRSKGGVAKEDRPRRLERRERRPKLHTLRSLRWRRLLKEFMR